MVTSLLTLVLIVGTVARLTRLLTTDQLFEPPRMWIIKRFGVDSQITYLAHCQWCLSVWLGVIGAVVFVLVEPLPGVNIAVQVVGVTAITSYLTGILGERWGAQVGGEA